jgi:thiamine-phosphate pyrophosphorylase
MSDCRLYLISPPKFDLLSFKQDLIEVLDGSDIACFQLKLEDATETEWLEAIKQLHPILKKKNIPLIIYNKLDLAKNSNVEGIHIDQDLTDKDGYVANLRQQLGGKIIGVSCKDSLDIAMVAGDEEADYVAFSTNYDNIDETIKFWSIYTVIPSVVEGDVTLTNCKDYISAGSNFLCVGESIWGHNAGPKQAIIEFNTLLKRN